ncbi:hypothetical protein MTER_31740 [Mycolicibacter terrae]|uniref:Uncharacterized protein n=1 Tax=Mycolicibacter terrae TaxID=1788 RepID=A0AAD1HZL3_9MYCO|nr:hypothetical protein [Mycolicibacter terrae]BBX23763.1 hypothetical protein MTER_31740 [Mycolicibacter terrae]SNV60162.1 Uncharacterised protein [Mycolicibacter terrae]
MDKLKQANAAITTARQNLAAAMKAAEAAAIEADANGVSEVNITTHLGVNRMTVRKWLGKDK